VPYPNVTDVYPHVDQHHLASVRARPTHRQSGCSALVALKSTHPVCPTPRPAPKSLANGKRGFAGCRDASDQEVQMRGHRGMGRVLLYSRLLLEPMGRLGSAQI